jgi:hypothetical protein
MVASDLKETEPPSDEELHLLRNVIDPLGIRTLELLSGHMRRQALENILEKENFIIANIEKIQKQAKGD